MHPTLTLEIFLAAEKRSAGQPYPVYMSNLAAIGVRSYHVSVDTHDRRIFSSAHNKHLDIPGSVTPPYHPRDTFDLEKLKTALHRTQTGQTNYLAFMTEIAEAGVHFYVADVENRKVSYHGKSPNAPYEETVPVIQNNN